MNLPTSCATHFLFKSIFIGAPSKKFWPHDFLFDRSIPPPAVLRKHGRVTVSAVLTSGTLSTSCEWWLPACYHHRLGGEGVDMAGTEGWTCLGKAIQLTRRWKECHGYPARGTGDTEPEPEGADPRGPTVFA
jgi:hypothetical protein